MGSTDGKDWQVLQSQVDTLYDTPEERNLQLPWFFFDDNTGKSLGRNPSSTPKQSGFSWNSGGGFDNDRESSTAEFLLGGPMVLWNFGQSRYFTISDETHNHYHFWNPASFSRYPSGDVRISF